MCDVKSLGLEFKIQATLAAVAESGRRTMFGAEELL